MIRAAVAAAWVIMTVAGLLVATAWDADADPITANLPAVVVDTDGESVRAPARRRGTTRRVGGGFRHVRWATRAQAWVAKRLLSLVGAPDWLPAVAPARGP